MKRAAYAELGARSNFTFLEGASHPHELVQQAHALGHAALGIADRNSFAGLVRATVAAEAEKIGLRFVPGCRLQLVDGQEYLAWPTDRAAYGRLSRMLSAARMDAPGECHLTRDALLADAEGLVLAAIPPEEVPATAAAVKLRGVATDFPARFAQDAAALRRSLALPLFCAASHRLRGDDEKRLDRLAAIAGPGRLLAVGGVRFHVPARRPLADVLAAIRLRTTVDALGFAAEANAEAHLKPPAEMARLFSRHPDAIAATIRVVEACHFSLRDLRYDYPEEALDPGRTPQETLEARVREACAEKYPGGTPPKVAAQLAEELRLIALKDYAAYFLTVHEIVRFANAKGILCQGRGSAANSAVCYVLGITAVAPDKHDMLFERFISAARDQPPDIDVDFEHERRETVIQHIYERYGRHRAAITATLIRYRTRSAVREVGKAMGLSDDITARLAKAGWGVGGHDLVEIAQAQGLRPEEDRRLALTLALAAEIQEFPRHLATHVGGFVIARDRLDELAIITRAAMPNRHVIEWDKDDIDALGILKVDVLGLGMLSCIRRAFALIAGAGGRSHTLQSVPQDCPETYAMLERADSLGVFQVESRAQMNMLPRLRPKEFYDLVVEVAIVRPGPIQGDMVHPYLHQRERQRCDKNFKLEFPKPHPDHGLENELEGVLKKTLGVPLFQEQAMQIAMTAAKFSADDADRLRRSMGKFRSDGHVNSFQQSFVEGMVRRGYEREFAERCFGQVRGFGSYGFPESHAASFAQLVYVSAWIKCHHPAAFAAALLNSQPMGFYAPAQIVRDAREHDVAVRPVDVNRSDWDCTLERDASGNLALRLGLRLVHGFGADPGEALVTARAAGPFGSVPELVRRAGLDRRAVAALAGADAFGSLALARREALWQAAGIEPLLPLAAPPTEPAPRLPATTAGEQTVLDYHGTGLTLRQHPMALLRPAVAALGAADTRALAAARQGAAIRVAGLVLVRQRPGSAKGVIFLTMEDEWGIANLVLYTDVARRCHAAVTAGRLVLARGRVERHEGGAVPIIHLIVRELKDHSALLDRLHQVDDGAGPWRRALAHADEVVKGSPGGSRRPDLPRSRDFH